MGNQRFSITSAKAALDMSVSDTVHRTLAILGTYGDRNGWCWPSQSTIAKIRGLKQPAIAAHIKKLKDLGYLNVYQREDEATKAVLSNRMQIKFDFNDTENNTPPITPDVIPPITPDVILTSHDNAPLVDSKESTQSATKTNPSSPADQDETSQPIEKATMRNKPEPVSKAALADLTASFNELTNLPLPPSHTKRLAGFAAARWWEPLRHMCRLSGLDVEKTLARMEVVVAKMREDGLTISAPASIQENFIASVADQPELSKGISVW